MSNNWAFGIAMGIVAFLIAHFFGTDMGLTFLGGLTAGCIVTLCIVRESMNNGK